MKLKTVLLTMALSLTPIYANATVVNVGFSPEGTAHDLVIKTIDSAKQEIRMMAYSFTDPDVMKSLINAKKSGVDIKIVIDDKGNRSQASVAAKNLMVNAGIGIRTNSTYPIQHDKVIIVDEKTVETGSYNYSKAAGNRNSENVIVINDAPSVAKHYLEHWQSRWDQGDDVSSTY